MGRTNKKRRIRKGKPLLMKKFKTLRKRKDLIEGSWDLFIKEINAKHE